MGIKKLDGKVAFCIEHGIDVDIAATGYNPSAYTDAKKKLAMFAYYGYTTHPTNQTMRSPDDNLGRTGRQALNYTGQNLSD